MKNNGIKFFNDSRISIANEAAFDGNFLSEPLTSYLVGWQPQEAKLRDLLDTLAPPVPTPPRFEYRVSDNKAAFAVMETDADIRAIGGEFAQITRKGSVVQARTYNKGVTIRLDRDEMENDPLMEEREVTKLRMILLRMEILRATALLASAATNAAKTWTYDSSTNPTPDPDYDVMDAMNAGGNASGLNPNRVVYSGGTWILRVRGYRAQNNAGAYASSQLTPDELAGWLRGGDLGQETRVAVSNLRYQSAASSKSQLIDNKVYVYNAMEGAGPDDPSNIKRFVSHGGGFRAYRKEVTSKLIDISVEHHSLIAVTNNLGIRTLTIS